MSNPVHLYVTGRATILRAVDALNNSAAPWEKGEFKLNADGIRKALTEAQQAVCLLRELDNRLNGVPEPRRGD